MPGVRASSTGRKACVMHPTQTLKQNAAPNISKTAAKEDTPARFQNSNPGEAPAHKAPQSPYLENERCTGHHSARL